jgi:hypothetical protein
VVSPIKAILYKGQVSPNTIMSGFSGVRLRGTERWSFAVDQHHPGWRVRGPADPAGLEGASSDPGTSEDSSRRTPTDQLCVCPDFSSSLLQYGKVEHPWSWKIE